MGAQVALRGVSRVYGAAKALDDVSVEIEPESAVALMGQSGAGKSTLLHLVGGMDLPDGGEVEIDGRSLPRRRLDAHRRRVGFVFQRFHLLPALSVLDNVLAPVLPYRVDFDRRARARELLEAVGLDGRERALPGELSGGQQQRVAIARALIGHPPLLLADEPTGNLDSATGEEIMELLGTLRRHYGMTMMIATHNPELAASCDRLIRLQDGRVVSDDRLEPSEDVLHRIGRLG
ncbi:ABC transporter ATP-binding protein [Sphaerisporangium melleum]|uniref:ABC transporter ATP-binding protein n=1 Tax=Sphaerisporangium melleum TaxID=321316 RepID=A0A917VD24_9ACTN|nr:ABC transporter ATP-binding protein [Sphaerisporangium melleum]GGK64192.1 ABC transporter ATP-binding protein [Sphaerisporangium melleum]GII70113.1 ABC transporter ATP-binding protein [Sphaerisporangium melleum]